MIYCPVLGLGPGAEALCCVQRKREAVDAVYELKPMADATKMPGTQGNTWSMGV